jgi:hypothetical protein
MLSAIVAHSFPNGEHLYIFTRQDLASTLETEENRSAMNSTDIITTGVRFFTHDTIATEIYFMTD